MSLKGTLAVVCLVLIAVSGGCTSAGSFPARTESRVDLSKANYRLVKANAVGSSSGFSLFMVLPIVPPRYTTAMSRLQEQAGMTEGKAQALVNVSQEQRSVYLLLFSIPTLTIRADVVEFTE
jgi:hypothetical protein